MKTILTILMAIISSLGSVTPTSNLTVTPRHDVSDLGDAFASAKTAALDKQAAQIEATLTKAELLSGSIDGSTEGGSLYGFFLNTAPVKIEMTQYGETGKERVSYYFDGGKPFLAVIRNVAYTAPTSDPNFTDNSFTESRTYLLTTDRSGLSDVEDAIVQSVESLKAKFADRAAFERFTYTNGEWRQVKD